jgi:hypothetical protein
MAGQVSPGIVLRERDLTNAVAVATQANTAAIVGSFEKGPVGVITTISTERELLDTFGKPNDNNYEDWYVASTFLSYGGTLRVVRVEDSTLENASDAGGGILLRSADDAEAQKGTTTYKLKFPPSMVLLQVMQLLHITARHCGRILLHNQQLQTAPTS